MAKFFAVAIRSFSQHYHEEVTIRSTSAFYVLLTCCPLTVFCTVWASVSIKIFVPACPKVVPVTTIFDHMQLLIG